jgi:DNA-binding CsgD family transcriptional regulator
MVQVVKLRADDSDTRFRAGLTVALCAIVAFGALDLVLDQPMSMLSFHAAVELTFIALCLGTCVYLWLGWMHTRHSLLATEETLTENRAERDLWRSRVEKHLRGLGAEIDAQLRRWTLTPAERETALLLLKGYGHRDIAALLGKSERTVRQQAVAVYRKSNLSGRAELSAFFLEDLLLPVSEVEGETPPSERLHAAAERAVNG